MRRKRKLTIRQTAEAGDERIRRGSRGSKEEVETERHERRESVVLPKTKDVRSCLSQVTERAKAKEE